MTDNSASPNINKSQLNNSTSKACYSFSKSPRNSNHKPLNDNIYEMPSMISQRSTSIGFGKKSEIGRKNSNPSPDKYMISSEFTKDVTKGKSFGVSRSDFKANPMITTGVNPGPGQYDNRLKQSNKNCFAIRGRDGFPNIFQSTHYPGPGEYSIKQDTQKQFYVNSRNKSPKTYTISKSRNSQLKQNDLGPGKYETSLASMGRQVLAHKKSETSFGFSKQNRETLPTIKSNIGPGSYHHFSQFGR